MTNDEAEKLARKLRSETFLPRGADPIVSGQDLRALCDHILSGSMKREIENAAYERAARAPTDLAQNWRATLAAYRHRWSPEQIKMYESAIEGVEAVAAAICALIHPPAQKEDGE